MIQRSWTWIFDLHASSISSASSIPSLDASEVDNQTSHHPWSPGKLLRKVLGRGRNFDSQNEGQDQLLEGRSERMKCRGPSELSNEHKQAIRSIMSGPLSMMQIWLEKEPLRQPLTRVQRTTIQLCRRQMQISRQLKLINDRRDQIWTMIWMQS